MLIGNMCSATSAFWKPLPQDEQALLLAGLETPQIPTNMQNLRAIGVNIEGFRTSSPLFVALKVAMEKAFRYQRIWQWDYQSN